MMLTVRSRRTTPNSVSTAPCNILDSVSILRS